MNALLSTEAKIAQLLMFGFHGTQVTPFIKDFIFEYNLGGIIHFARNFESPKQLANLNRELQNLAQHSPNSIGLLIAVDQEGGTVARLTEGVAVAPSAMALGAVQDETTTEQVCTVSGRELAAMGINMNFAPVVDVNSNPINPVIGVRSFGENPKIVARQGAAAIRGYQKYVGAVVKHFPGHGDTSLDSHLDLPVVRHGRERLEKVEFLPFKAAIAQSVMGVMSAHVAFPAVEPTLGLPSTLSYEVLTKLLREEMGFKGLIITDCMEMAAITKAYDMEEAAVMAIEAGADLILVSQTEERQRQAFRGILSAVKSGRIPEERLDQSLARVLQAKKRIFAISQPPLDMVGSPGHIEVMREAIRRSITVVRDDGNLPLLNKRTLVVEPRKIAANIAEDILADKGTLAAALKSHGIADLESVEIKIDISLAEQGAVLAKAQEFDQIVVVTTDAHRHPSQVGLVRALVEADLPVIVVGARTPYEIRELPEASTYVAA
jgi:beta-N-acetylhexosaminidase